MNNLTLKIDQLVYGGRSIGRHNGKVVMISGAVLPGEVVEVNVERDRRDYTEASVLKILEPSTDRIKPECKHFGICGGCNYQHIPYDLQVRLKEEIFKDCLKRFANSDIALAGPVIGENKWHYRIRAQFKVAKDCLGFHKKGTRDIINIDSCPLMSRSINGFINNSVDLFNNVRIKEIHITGKSDLIAQVIARRHSLLPIDAERLAFDLIDCGISGVKVKRGERDPMHFGQTSITIDLGKFKFTVSPSSFVQSNWDLNQTVVDVIRNILQPLKGRKVLDLYAGSGNLSIPLAEEAEVVAVEENAHAIVDGNRNLEVNNISNCEFINNSAEGFFSRDSFDIVIVNPPRPGLSNKVIENIFEFIPEKIIYVSCNPATFARDFKKLQSRYDAESIRIIDFFPQTSHIESLACLTLR
jgi:23S rRNA (uracil1939-C5)-methyltransferase